jgi:phenylacetate-CoA ligase
VGNVVGSLLFRGYHRVRSSPTLSLLPELSREPFVPAEVALARQLQRTRRLVEHCEQNVPFYRRRFADLGLRSSDIQTMEDFARLPVLTKADVAANGGEMIAEGLRPETLLAQHSGGSTGVPLRFYRDVSYVAASEAGTYRNLAQCGWHPGEMIGFFWGWNDRLNGMSRPEFLGRQFVRRMYQFDPFRSGPQDMLGWWQAWRIWRPRVALGYASTIARFARFLYESSLKPTPLRGVFTTAEKLFPQQRSVIEAVFGCQAFDCYGSSEVQNIASECRNGQMHINTDFVHVETDSRESGEDGPAPLLVTSLRNYAMPFLRYRNEDRGELLPGGCTCGNGFPLMNLNVARVSDNFRLPNDRVVHGEFFTHLLYGAEGVDSFQFHQTAHDRIILRYVPAAQGDPMPAMRAAAEQIDALAPGLIKVDIEVVSRMPLSSAGKHRFTRSDLA